MVARLAHLPFADRSAAGRWLAAELRSQRNSAGSVVVVGLARGGVPVADEVARVLGAPLGVLLALRLWIPGQPERAAGAVAPGARFILEDVVRALEISAEYIYVATKELETELARRRVLFPETPPLADRDVIIVDDGLASGATAAAAIQSVRLAGARHITFAAPAGSSAGLQNVRTADQVIVPLLTREARTVSGFYEDFAQLTDEQVCAYCRERMKVLSGGRK